MKPERWEQVKQIYQAALDLPGPERLEYVRVACTGDDELLWEVDSLLKSEANFDDFLLGVAAEYVPGALPEDEPPDANIGRRIGPYRIVREIGAGGMGAVYLAERVDEFRQKVALKLMGPGMDSRLVVARFRHERQILAGLEHPNIARLLEGGATEDGRPYFVMEYVEGVPIDRYCDRHELGLADRLRLFRQVCAAVQYAHQNLVVHRDIKPGNILVGEDGTPKLLDFGIAKLIGPQEASLETAALTQVGIRLMTPEYASPEQVRGLPIATATDVYSLGVVLYQMLTGRLPYEFQTQSLSEMERVVCEVDPPAPSIIVRQELGVSSPGLAQGGRESGVGSRSSKQLSGDLDIIVLKALEKDAKHRYGSVEQFSDDIRRHLESVPIGARRPTLMYRTGKFVRRNRTAVLAGVLVVVMLTGGLITTGWEAHVARQERSRAERRFNDVRHLAEAFLFEFHDKIKDLPGSTPARKLVVQRALDLLQGLTQEVRGNSPMERELADAYIKVGDVQGNPYISNLGDTAGALSSYRQALAIAGNVLRQNPGDLEARHYLALAHRSIGEILPLRGDPGGAVPEFHEAISLMETVSAAEPQNLAARFDISTCYENLGDVLGHSGLVNLGDVKAARTAYEKALAIDQAALAAEPSNVRARRRIAVVRVKIGDLEVDSGGDALSNYQAAARVFEGLAADNPADAEASRTFAMIHRKIGYAFEVAGQNAAAAEQYRKAEELQRQLMLADPTNKRARMDYAVAVKNRADLLSKAGDNKAALPVYREVLAVIEPLAIAEPGNFLLRGRYAEMLVDIGELLAGLHQNEEALRMYGHGLAITKELADRPAAPAEDLRQYAETLLDSPIDQLRNSAAAISYARRASEMTNGEAPDYLEPLARAYFQAGDASNAVAFQEKALAQLQPSPARKAAEDRLKRYRAAVKNHFGR